ncbi:phage tail protein [Laribacter hongkongensis]|uniref:phage tail protein n=1 Tax=Laribacter hongkongensis TaxID=168471 RepID=UPI001EFC3BD8|nr:phage tail protein [Laribacter hongkongensis]MCG9124290.1 phage tail protein [Laribacter hongkongensis]
MSQFFAILTAVGEAKLANAAALGSQLQLTAMAVGDGNGAATVPVRTQTALVRERRRAPLNSLFIDPLNANQIVAEQVIPEEVGDFWIREGGLYDADGDLCAVANFPDTYKPLLSSGSGRTQVIRMVLIVSSTSAVTLKVDPAVVLATKAELEKAIAAHLVDVDPHQQYLTKIDGAAKIAKAIADLVASSPAALDTLKELAAALGNDPNFATTMTNALAAKAPLASPALTGAPTAPTAAAGTNSTQLANTAFVQAAIASLVASSPAALDTLKELAAALGNDPNFATTMTNALAAKAPLVSPVLSGTPTAPTAAVGANNTQIANMQAVQQAVNGKLTKSVAGGANVALTATEAGYAMLELTGALTANIAVIVPTASCQWIVKNATSGAYTMTVKTAAGTGVVVTQGLAEAVWCDGTNVLEADGGKADKATTIAGYGITDALTLAAFTGANQSLAANGYQKLPGGLIVQWGVLATPGVNTTMPVTFPIAFPAACRFVGLSGIAGTIVGSSDGGCYATSLTPAGFGLVNSWDGSINPATVYWFAIGY